jgi:serine/threonine protein kinase
MKLKAGSVVVAAGAPDEHSSRWEVLEPVQTTRLRESYLARSGQPECNDHKVLLTVCRYNPRLLANQEYVDNVRRKLLHEAEMLTIPHNALPEPVDLFMTENDQDQFQFSEADHYRRTEPVLVTEALHGKPLDVLITEQGPLPEARALRIVRKIADFLAELHDHGILAYELRPEDILVDVHDHDRVWIGSCANYQVTREGVVRPGELVVPLSDFAFTAPEVEVGVQPLDRRSDLYSLGALLLYLLAGKPPAQVSLSSLPLSPETTWLLGSCLAPLPRQRLSSCAELHEALDDAITGLPLPAPPQVIGLRAELMQGKLMVCWELPPGWSDEMGLVLLRWRSGNKPPPDVALWKLLLDEQPSRRTSWEEISPTPGETYRYALVSQAKHGDYRKRGHPVSCAVEIPETWGMAMGRVLGSLLGRARR